MKLSILSGIPDAPLGAILNQLQNARPLFANRKDVFAQMQVRKIDFATQAIVNAPPQIAASIVANIAKAQDISPSGELIMPGDEDTDAESLEGINTSYRGWKIAKTVKWGKLPQSWKGTNTNKGRRLDYIFTTTLKQLKQWIDEEEDATGLSGMNSYRGWKILRQQWWWTNTSGNKFVKWKAVNPKVTTDWITARNLHDIRNQIDNFWDQQYEANV